MSNYPRPDGEPSPGNKPDAAVVLTVIAIAIICLVVGALGGWG
jgi:hypothetical protein